MRNALIYRNSDRVVVSRCVDVGTVRKSRINDFIERCGHDPLTHGVTFFTQNEYNIEFYNVNSSYDAEFDISRIDEALAKKVNKLLDDLPELKAVIESLIDAVPGANKLSIINNSVTKLKG